MYCNCKIQKQNNNESKQGTGSKTTRCVVSNNSQGIYIKDREQGNIWLIGNDNFNSWEKRLLMALRIRYLVFFLWKLKAWVHFTGGRLWIVAVSFGRKRVVGITLKAQLLKAYTAWELKALYGQFGVQNSRKWIEGTLIKVARSA